MIDSPSNTFLDQGGEVLATCHVTLPLLDWSSNYCKDSHNDDYDNDVIGCDS